MKPEMQSVELREFLGELSASSVDDVDFTDLTATCVDDDTVLHKAIWAHYFELAREMVKLGIDVNVHGDMGYTPLHVTATKGCLELTAFLLDHGANPLATNENDVTPAILAARKQNIEVLDCLRRQSPKSDQLRSLEKAIVDDLEPVYFGKLLQDAVVTNDVKLVKELVYLGADQDFRPGTCGRKPIHFAAMVGNLEIAEFLTRTTGFVRLPDSEGYTPLGLAEALGHADVVEFFRDTEKAIHQHKLEQIRRSVSETGGLEDKSL